MFSKQFNSSNFDRKFLLFITLYQSAEVWLSLHPDINSTLAFVFLHMFLLNWILPSVCCMPTCNTSPTTGRFTLFNIFAHTRSSQVCTTSKHNLSSHSANVNFRNIPVCLHTKSWSKFGTVSSSPSYRSCSKSDTERRIAHYQLVASMVVRSSSVRVWDGAWTGRQWSQNCSKFRPTLHRFTKQGYAHVPSAARHPHAYAMPGAHLTPLGCNSLCSMYVGPPLWCGFAFRMDSQAERIRANPTVIHKPSWYCVNRPTIGASYVVWIAGFFPSLGLFLCTFPVHPPPRFVWRLLTAVNWALMWPRPMLIPR